ncbi:MAG: zf-HC2 domain-containing protein [Bacteroidales bacterium]|nr:zf-HC2 domain-containing protein [Bacteroidales bacterium]
METTRLIEQYLDGTLSAEERNAVEKRASGDEVFRKLIVLHKEVNDCIRDNDFFTLREQIAGIDKDFSPHKIAGGANPRKKLQPVSYRLLARIAALLILLAAAGFILRVVIFNHPSAERIYQKYYTVYDLDVIYRSAPARNTSLDEAILSYDRGKYQDALSKLNVILSEDQDNYMARFCQGLALMETDDPVSAIHSFREIPTKWYSPFAEHRDWYLALALLKTNHAVESSEIFGQIASADGYYARRAEQILKSLND